MSTNRLSLLVNFVGVDRLSGSLRNIVGLGRQGSRSLNDLRGEGRRLETQLRKVRQELSGASGNVTGLIDRERDLERQIEETNRAIERRGRLNAIEGDRRAMIARGDALMERGRENMTQGAAIAAPLVLAVAQAAQFSSGMVDIQQKMGLSNREADALGGRIRSMAAAAKLMPEDMRAGIDMLGGLGGLSLQQIEAAMGPAGRLATAYRVDLADAAAAAHASITNLQVPASQAARIFDTMAAAGNEGGFEVRDMARHFPSLTAQMRALGQTGIESVANLSAALQVVRASSGNADEAATAVTNLLGKINAPATIRAFEKNFGVDLPAAMARLESQGYSTMEAIALITQQATGGDLRKLGFAFEDREAQAGIRALIQNMDEFRRVRAAAMASGGTVDAAFDQRVARDASVQWTAFKASASQLGIVLGTTLLPVANEALGMITRLASGVARWAEANPEAAATLTRAVAALAVFKLGLGAAQIGLGFFLKPLANVIAISRQLGGVARIFGVVRTAALFMGRGLLQAGMMMMANPMVLAITAIVLAIGAAAYLIYTHWDTIKAAFNTGVARVKGILGGVPNWLRNIGRLMMDGLLGAINPLALAQRLLRMARNGVNAFKEYLGIKSPSRLFMALGSHTTEGLARGIERGGGRPMRAMGQLARGVTAAGVLGVSSLSPAAAAGTGGASAAPISVTINVYQQPGQDARAVAEQIRRELERLERIRSSASYEDLG